MCGITGIFNPHREVDLSRFYDAHLLIKHRGPDDEGIVALEDQDFVFYKGDDTIPQFDFRPHISRALSSHLVLGHRRLSILDLSSAGHQPQVYGDIVIVYNGEIYNFIELREELESLGYQFSSTSDTEVLLKAYDKWGVEVFAKLNGMWAVAIFNKKTGKVILSRDRFGQKPLYYSEQSGTLIFGSENKFIRGFSNTQYTLDEIYLSKYIYQGISDFDSTSAYEGIRELEPGTILEYDKSGGKIFSYWDFEPKYQYKTENDALEDFGAIFTSALELRMRSDVPVGCLLSGGLDSSLIVCLLHTLGYLDKSSFRTFSAVFAEEKYSEKKYIEEVQRSTGCQSTFVYPDQKSIETMMPVLLHHAEMPFRSLSYYSKYQIYKETAAQSNIKVALIGQGSDEAFGGYTADYYTAIVSYLGRMQLGRASHLIGVLMKERNVSSIQILKSVAKRLSPSIMSLDYYNKTSFSKVTYASLREYLKNDDRNSMAHGIEVRSPFMDYRLMEFGFSINAEHKINKKVVRRYARGVVPDVILDRTDKMGFVSPQESWQRDYLKKPIEDAYRKLHSTGTFLDMKVEDEILRKFLVSGNHWQRVWRVYCYAQWLELNLN